MSQVASWCQNHGKALMGHMMQEPTLRSQTESLGEAMRCYRNLDVPGIDILHDAVEYNTAKQAVSVSRQRNGARGVTMSEQYGGEFSCDQYVVYNDCADPFSQSPIGPLISPDTKVQVTGRRPSGSLSEFRTCLP